MKHFSFKIFKYSTILKKIDRIKDSFSQKYKYIKSIPNHILDFFGTFIKYTYSSLIKNTKSTLNDLSKIYKHFDFSGNNLLRKLYKLKNINYKKLGIYFLATPVFLVFIYLILPSFFKYNKLDLEKRICENQNIKCSIDGEIKYNFFPTPKIIIKNMKVYDFNNKKDSLGKIDKTVIKLSIFNLYKKEKQKYKKIILNDFIINFNLKNIARYKNFNFKKNSFIPIKLQNGKIKLLDNDNYVSTINNANLNLILKKNFGEAILKGKFLGDNIYIKVNNKKIDNYPSTNITLKMPNATLLSKINLLKKKGDNKAIDGKILLKQGKNKFTSIFLYKNNEIIIDKSNIRNAFLDGKLTGKIKLLPYFDFDLDLNLNSLNFSKLRTAFLALEEKDKKNLLKINNKINGKLNISANKIYSKSSLANSLESRLKFNNGNVFIEQLLFNLGKLGAADLLGSLNNEKEFSNFKFEANIYLDNKKKFLSKFNVYNKTNIPSNLFFSGSFNLDNLKISLYEISEEKKLTQEDINFIENEFNEIMLEENYNSLFSFPKLKEFVKSVVGEQS